MFNEFKEEIKKANFNVSIVDCMIDNNNIVYAPQHIKINSLCVYTHFDRSIINKIKSIAESMNYKTFIRTNKTLIELFVY